MTLEELLTLRARTTEGPWRSTYDPDHSRAPWSVTTSVVQVLTTPTSGTSGDEDRANTEFAAAAHADLPALATELKTARATIARLREATRGLVLDGLPPFVTRERVAALLVRRGWTHLEGEGRSGLWECGVHGLREHGAALVRALPTDAPWGTHERFALERTLQTIALCHGTGIVEVLVELLPDAP